MYQREVAKAKTASKTITYQPEILKRYVLETLKEASTLVGSTLGPNGKVVLIERQENLGPYVTKDGITVFNSMAYADPTKQSILESARDSSSKTNSDAGDGTTTATILAEALIRKGFEFLEKNPKASTQKVMRDLEKAYDEVIKKFIETNAIKITNKNSKDLLKKVALVATNYDEEMSSAVIECFDLVGHGGNVTIVETPGVSGFEVEKVEGLPISRGFEDSCGRFLEEFINDKENYRTVMDRPKFILYNGKVNDLNVFGNIFNQIGEACDTKKYGANAFSGNVVIMAHSFSDNALAALAANFKDETTILKIVPLKTPMTGQANSQYHFLLDVSAFTGAKVFDPLTSRVESAELSHVGIEGIKTFEYNRYRSTILGSPDPLLIQVRAAELEQQMKSAESIYDKEILNERLALLTGGIAKIKVFGSSEAELKEKRHRVEDAVASVKGAIQHGVLPGCSKTLITLSNEIKNNPDLSDAVKQIMVPALNNPFVRIFENGGSNLEEITEIYKNVTESDFWHTYDAMNLKYGNAIEIGIIDSAAAVKMAIKNSLAVSKMLMGLSGIVVFKRDLELEHSIARTLYSEQAEIKKAEDQAKYEEFEV